MNFEPMHNIHAGEACVIAGNGPSLRSVPDGLLDKYLSFGSNRVFLPGGFSPNYYVAVNPLVIGQSIDEIRGLDCNAKFIQETMLSHFPGAYGLTSYDKPTFSYNPAAYVYEGFTVTYVALQIAYFMGFETVLLVGVDHSYKMDAQPNTETTWEGDDPNHFNRDYFKGLRWNNPDLVRSAEAYRLAKSAYETDDRRIINLTEGSKLDVFEKGELEKWM